MDENFVRSDLVVLSRGSDLDTVFRWSEMDPDFFPTTLPGSATLVYWLVNACKSAPLRWY